MADGGNLGRLLILIILLVGGVPAWAQTPKRVVTVNLCLDQLALRLAAPGQLVGVSELALDPRLSVMAAAARTATPVRPTAEAILRLKPDLVILDEASHAGVRRLLRQAGVTVFEVPWASSLDDLEVLVTRVAGALGREAQAQTLMEGIRAQRRRLSWRGPPVGTAAILQANGGTAGKGSLMDDLLRVAGFRNLASELGIGVFGRISLETVLAGQPDLLVVDGESNDDPSRATEFIEHRALRELAERARLVSVPIRHVICAGPENLDAVRLLVDARRSIVGPRR